MLRFDSPVQMTSRTALCDTEIDGAPRIEANAPHRRLANLRGYQHIPVVLGSSRAFVPDSAQVS